MVSSHNIWDPKNSQVSLKVQDTLLNWCQEAPGAVPGGGVVARHLDGQGGHGGQVHVEGDRVGGGGVQGGHARRPQLG